MKDIQRIHCTSMSQQCFILFAAVPGLSGLNDFNGLNMQDNQTISAPGRVCWGLLFIGSTCKRPWTRRSLTGLSCPCCPFWEPMFFLVLSLQTCGVPIAFFCMSVWEEPSKPWVLQCIFEVSSVSGTARCHRQHTSCRNLRVLHHRNCWHLTIDQVRVKNDSRVCIAEIFCISVLDWHFAWNRLVRIVGHLKILEPSNFATRFCEGLFCAGFLRLHGLEDQRWWSCHLRHGHWSICWLCDSFRQGGKVWMRERQKLGKVYVRVHQATHIWNVQMKSGKTECSSWIFSLKIRNVCRCDDALGCWFSWLDILSDWHLGIAHHNARCAKLAPELVPFVCTQE